MSQTHPLTNSFVAEPTCQCNSHEHDDETSPINYTAAISIARTLANIVLEQQELTQQILQLQEIWIG